MSIVVIKETGKIIIKGVGVQGIQGIQGDQGIQGPDGVVGLNTVGYDELKTALQAIINTNTAKTGVTTELKPEDINTLAKLNAILTDATLINTNDARLSDARTPLSHTHLISQITDFDSANVAYKNVNNNFSAGQTINAGVGTLSTGLSFGTSNSGIFEVVDGYLGVQLNGVNKYKINSSYMGSLATDGGSLAYSGSSSTNPSIVPRGDDLNTGVGHPSNPNELSLITGGVETVRLIANEFKVNGKTITEKLNINAVPTNTIGLNSGDVWSDSGTLKIIP